MTVLDKDRKKDLNKKSSICYMKEKSQLTWEKNLGRHILKRQFLEAPSLMECTLYTSENSGVP